MLAQGRRTLIMGSAGSGKTTLLRWIAVRSARGDFPGPLGTLNNTVPFFIPLRRYVNRDLPAPEGFPLAVGTNVAHEMPTGWVHNLLRAGRALVLVDGVDEMPDNQRDRVRTWLADLLESFNAARYIITSRPAAIEEGWLDRLGFATTELQPMSTADVAEFIHQWHEAVRTEILDAGETSRLADYERSLLAAIDTDRHLRALTVSPLLCALVCALNRERRTQLPADRMDIYAAALEMLLDRRDRERGVSPGDLQLARSDKVLLLQDIAFWLVRNGWSDAPSDRVATQLERSARHLQGASAEAGDIFRSLLERSGLLREPTTGRVDFVHRTFQEYLAGKAAAENDEIGQLVRNAHDGQWREVIVMAAGHARPDQCSELLQGLIRRGRRHAQRNRFWPLAVACMQSARRIEPRLRAQLEGIAEQLVPPATDDAAEALSATGEMLLDLLRVKQPRTEAEAAASIRAVATVGGMKAMQLIADILARHAGHAGGAAGSAAVNAWRFFKPDQYAAEVLARSWPAQRELQLPGPSFLHVLPAVPQLRAVRCDFGNYRTPAAKANLGPITANQNLRSVTLTGCSGDIDLTPLLRLPLLDDMELSFTGTLPDLELFSSIARPWELSLECRTTGESLRALARFQSLTKLELIGCEDVTDLKVLPPRPRSLDRLTLYGFPGLQSLAGIESWQGLKGIWLFECPHLAHLGPLASMSSLEEVRLGLFESATTANLGPLAELPNLRELTLMGHGEFDLTQLAGKQNLIVQVPAGSSVTGTGKLGAESRIIEFTYKPASSSATRER
jgi:hypothetical protein